MLVLGIHHQEQRGRAYGEEDRSEGGKRVVEVEEQQEKQDGHIGDVVGELADDKRPLKENGGHGYQDDSQGFVAPCMRGQIRMDGLVEERLVVWRQQAHLGEDAEKGPDGQPEDGNELYDGIFVEIIEHLKR